MFTLEDVDRAIRPCGGKFILGDGRHSLAPLKITSRNICRHSEKYDRKHGVTHAQKIFRENRIELLRIMAQ